MPSSLQLVEAGDLTINQHDSTMINLPTARPSRDCGGIGSSTSMNDDTAKNNLGYSLMSDVRIGAVSPEEFKIETRNLDRNDASTAFAASSSLQSESSFSQVTSSNSNCQFEVSAFNTMKDDDDVVDVKAFDNFVVGNNSTQTRSINVPLESSEKHKLHQKVSDSEPNQGIVQNSTVKRKYTDLCDPSVLVNVSFRDIIGHGQAKLRLDEAILPLALPVDLADSVLTGACL